MSKGIFWSNPNDNLKVIDTTDEAAKAFGFGFGSDLIVLKQEHIDALLSGKCLAWHDSEYSTFVIMDSALEKYDNRS